MFHEDILYCKRNYELVICIAKNFIWTTVKVIFSIFRFFCTLRFQIDQILILFLWLSGGALRLWVQWVVGSIPREHMY